MVEPGQQLALAAEPPHIGLSPDAAAQQFDGYALFVVFTLPNAFIDRSHTVVADGTGNPIRPESVPDQGGCRLTRQALGGGLFSAKASSSASQASRASTSRRRSSSPAHSCRRRASRSDTGQSLTASNTRSISRQRWVVILRRPTARKEHNRERRAVFRASTPSSFVAVRECKGLQCH